MLLAIRRIWVNILSLIDNHWKCLRESEWSGNLQAFCDNSVATRERFLVGYPGALGVKWWWLRWVKAFIGGAVDELGRYSRGVKLSGFHSGLDLGVRVREVLEVTHPRNWTEDGAGLGLMGRSTAPFVVFDVFVVSDIPHLLCWRCPRGDVV